MKSLSVKKGRLISEVTVPASKSYANRALILCSLSKKNHTICNMPLATDVTNLISCLKEIGIKIEQSGNEVRIQNSFPACENGNKTFEVGEGGTTARFLAVLLLLGRAKYTLVLGDRLKLRPWSVFLNVARELGATVSLKDNILSIQGPVSLPPVLEVDASETTQFATAFELLTISEKFRVIPKSLNSSQSYWEMNKEVIYEISGGEVYSVPLDWSSASYPMAFAALNHEVFFPGLVPDKYQADAKLFQILTELQSIKERPEGISVHPILAPKRITLDVSDCLDLVPTLSYLLAHVPGEHTLTGFKNLVHKESDRLQEVLALLKIFERETLLTESHLKIFGSDRRLMEAKKLQFPDDHRMVMAGTLFLRHHGGGEVSPVDAVKKSYPDFFKLFE